MRHEKEKFPGYREPVGSRSCGYHCIVLCFDNMDS